tara:strand:+ start:354 stop:722 length:369 start_codon:yes stop_codon:yes gene_type:complete
MTNQEKYDLLKKYNNGTLKPEVGMYCNQFGYSDAHPYEIIKVSDSGKTLTIRSMESKLDPTWKPEMVAGGYSAHCVNNNSQKWIIKSDAKGYTLKVRLGKKGYSKGTFRVGLNPIRHYDYNF